jgi:hypothetical protein
MTAQGYGNQESVDETTEAKKGVKPAPGEDSPRRNAAPASGDRRDEATPGEGAGPAPQERRQGGGEADPGLG